jgi:Periplasmic protein TonB, links inner and outer membranes
MGTLEIYDPNTFKLEGFLQLYCPDIFGHPSLQLINRNYPLLTDGEYVYIIGKKLISEKLNSDPKPEEIKAEEPKPEKVDAGKEEKKEEPAPESEKKPENPKEEIPVQKEEPPKEKVPGQEEPIKKEPVSEVKPEEKAPEAEKKDLELEKEDPFPPEQQIPKSEDKAADERGEKKLLKKELKEKKRRENKTKGPAEPEIDQTLKLCEYILYEFDITDTKGLDFINQSEITDRELVQELFESFGGYFTFNECARALSYSKDDIQVILIFYFLYTCRMLLNG